MSGPRFIANMDEWMRDQERRTTSVERRRRVGPGSAASVGTDMNEIMGGTIIVDEPAVALSIKNWPVEAIPRMDNADANNPAGSYRTAPGGTARTTRTPTRVQQDAVLFLNSPTGKQIAVEFHRYRGLGGSIWSRWAMDHQTFFAANPADQVYWGKNTAPSWDTGPVIVGRTEVSPNGPYYVNSPDGVQWFRDGGGTYSRQASPTWVSPGWQGSWHRYSAGFNELRAIRTATGWVKLQALGQGGAVGSVITVLPPGMRPAMYLPFSVVASGNTAARIDVHPDGRVMMAGLTAGSTTVVDFVSLDSVRFPAADVAPFSAWTPLPIAAPWQATQPGTPSAPNPCYWQDSLGRIALAGLVTRQGIIPEPGADTPFTPQLPAMFNIAQVAHYVAGVASGSLFQGIHQNGGTDNRLWWKTGFSGSSAWFSLANTVILPTARFPENGWVSHGFAPNWGNYGTATYEPASMWRSSDGMFEERGLVTGPGATQITQDSAAGDRPGSNATSLFTAYGTTQFARVDQTTAGSLVLGAGNATWLSLRGIHFMAEA